MRSMTLEGETGITSIELGSPLAVIGQYCSGRRLTVITDSTVYSLHRNRFPKGRTVVIGAGECSKTLATVFQVYECFLSGGLDRSSLVVGIGGGVVCDIAGFCASTYLRGLPFGYVPTTLLAQVDASVGGKNGVNFKRYKNMIGTFNQPQFVMCDFDLLKTLPQEDIRNGLAEVIKHALIGDDLLFARLEEVRERILALDGTILEEIVHASLKVKIGIVSQDERENGERRKLNFGHTMGHAVEKTLGLSHGEAVSIGMVMEARMAVAKGALSPKVVDRITRLLHAFGLPVHARFDKGAVMDAVTKDKKRDGQEIHCVLLEEIGSARVDRMKIEEFEELLDDLCEHC